MADSLTWADLEFIEQLGMGRAGSVGKFRLRKALKEFPAGSYVAVKQYKSWVIEEPGVLERIVRELDVGRKIRHPNLVRTLTLVRDDRGVDALVMQFYPGEPLQTYLEKTRSENSLCDPEFTFKVIEGLAGALAAIHNKGLIHRDLKPANVQISPDGSPILMDLGVIKRRRDAINLTTEEAFLGTIKYAAPEYLFGEEYDARIDIYSLGAIAYELITGLEFMGSERNWARLVRNKSYTPSFNFAFEHTSGLDANGQKTLEDKYGIKRLRFLLYILESSLVSLIFTENRAQGRNLDVKSLTVAINNRRWEKGNYYFTNGIFGEGFPGFLPLDPDTTNKNAARAAISRTNYQDPFLDVLVDPESLAKSKSAKEIVDDVVNQVTRDQFAALKHLVKTTLWDEQFDGEGIEMDHNHWTTLERIGAITYCDYDKHNDRVYYGIPNSLKYAYIYDLLQYSERRTASL